MTEFKQIIGRGTRLYPEYGKEYFTIMDYRNACRLFADPEFDGDPVVIIEGGDGGEGWNPEDTTIGDNSDEPINTIEPVGFTPPVSDEFRTKYHVHGVSVNIINERVQYYDKNGKLFTESITDYSRRNILNEYATLDEFLTAWTTADKKKAIIDELIDQGVLLDALKEKSGKQLDDFDLILHIAFDKKPLTKKERVDHVKRNDYLNNYSDVCRDVLDALLEKYMNEGISELEDTRILDNAPFDRIGSPKKIAKLFGGKEAYILAVKALEHAIYSA